MIFSYNIYSYKNDESRITSSLMETKDFAKKFFLEALNNSNKNKSDIKDIYSYFDKMKFFDYKGSDILKRQIFFFHLKLINFYDIDNEHMTDQLILYLAECNHIMIFIYLDIKTTISALKNKSSQRLSFIIFGKDVLRKNYPTVYFIKTASKIVSSLILNLKLKIDDIEIVLFQPGIMLKLFIYFLRIYVDSNIWNRIEFVENYEMLNEKFFLEIDEETEYENIRVKFMNDKNVYEDMAHEKNMNECKGEEEICKKLLNLNSNNNEFISKSDSNVENNLDKNEKSYEKNLTEIKKENKLKVNFDFYADDDNSLYENDRKQKEEYCNIIN